MVLPHAQQKKAGVGNPVFVVMAMALHQCPVDLNPRWYNFITNEPESQGVDAIGSDRYILDHEGKTYILGTGARTVRARPSKERPRMHWTLAALSSILGMTLRKAISWWAAPRRMKRYKR
jgi:hypothetical protein